MLANELARGRDRLAGKKLLIWQFAARELAFGNWKLLDLKLGTPASSRFFTPAAGETLEVSGIVETISSVPRPGSVPYADHIAAVHVSDITVAGRPATEALQSVVYLSTMRDNVWTPAARLRPGERIKLRLRAWSDVAPQYEQINRSEIDDPELQLEEPVWGELMQ
jgi:alginate O-acetyltransferase complex protein AlgJ